MASRTPVTTELDLIKVFVTLETFGATDDAPVSTKDFSLEMGVTELEAFHALDSLADAELVDGVGQDVNTEWWISVPDVSATNAESIAREALSNAEPVVKVEPKKLTAKELAYKERTAYNAAVAASQEPDSQHLHPMADTRPVEPEFKAQTPVIAADGTAVTVPVDPENGPKDPRRALDAAKGEKLLSEETITVKVAPKPLPVIDGLDQFIDAETGDMVYESRIVKNGLALPEPESIPERPAGVHPNTWDLAHTAITQTARDHWLRKATADAKAYAENVAA